MQAIHRKYRLFEKKLFLKKIYTAIGLITLMNHRKVIAGACHAVDASGKEREDYFVSLVRYYLPNIEIILFIEGSNLMRTS
jgi:hypothetical protein